MVVERLALAAAQVLVLLLHLGKGDGEASYDMLKGGVVGVGLDEQAKVEDELVALVLCVGDDDGLPEDGVLAVGGVDGDEAVAKGLPGDDVLLQDVEVDERRARGGVRGRDASWGRLGDDLGAWASRVSLFACLGSL